MCGIQNTEAFNKALQKRSKREGLVLYYETKSGGLNRCYPMSVYVPVVCKIKKERKKEMADKKQKTCPHCGGNTFLASITIPGMVGVYVDENGNDAYDVLKKVDSKMGVQIVKCSKCKELLKEEDLVVGVPCKECGAIVPASDLNEDGICSVCAAKKARPELASMSQEDLLRMYLELEKKVNVNTKLQKKIEKAEQAVADMKAEEEQATAEEPVTEVADEAPTEEAVEETPVEEEKPKRKRRKKKADADTQDDADEQNEEQAEEVPEEISGEVSEEEAVQETENLADSQAAPFPDVKTEDPGPAEKMNADEEGSDAQEGAVDLFPTDAPPQNVGGFAMFDDTEERF